MLLDIILLFTYGLLAFGYYCFYKYNHSYDNRINHANLCLTFAWSIIFVIKFIGIVVG